MTALRGTDARRGAVSVAVVSTVLVLGGCGLEAVTDAAGSVVETAVESGVGRVVVEELQQAGIPIDGVPDCTADVDLAGADVSGTCVGRTTSGQAVTATFEGGVDGGACSVLLVLAVDGEEVSRTQPTLPCTPT